MSITILEHGLHDSFQDLGRFGFAHIGINHNGAMDPVAAATANYLAGNEENEAVLECHFQAATIRFNTAALIAVTGADFTPVLNDEPVPMHTPVFVPPHAVLRFLHPGAKKGARTYVAVHGGYGLVPWLGSYSTNTRAHAGGFCGRTLRAGDEIGLRNKLPFTGTRMSPMNWHADTASMYAAGNTIRVIRGNEYGLLNECADTILEGNTFIVSSQSDRMGYRLNGSPLQTIEHAPMISSAVTRGTIQLLPGGQLIILMTDHQTTGGYPRIAHVISADIPKLAQTPINTAIRFEMISFQEAEALYLAQQHQMLQLRNACGFKSEVVGDTAR